jgi:N-acetylmuramoyl-L-alanine amidase
MKAMKKIKICLDAGHYGKYNRSPAVPEYYESDMNWKLHLLLKKYLEEYGIEVTQTRSNQETDLGLTARGRKGEGCDLLLSIHSNAVGNGVNESVDYPVVYVPLNGSGTVLGEKLASRIASVMETRQSGRAESRKGSGNWDYYSVIYGAVSVGVPGLILEHSFHTNTRSTQWLMVDSNLDKLAQAEADVIASHYGLVKPQKEEPKAEPKIYYRVQVGAYRVKKYADEQLAKVKKAGFNAILVYNDGMYKVQVGAYSIKANADNMIAKVKSAGFDAFITSKGGTMVAEEKKSVAELAKEVIQGKWGNGNDRKKKLTEAGYDYTAVQNEVNRLLK